MIHQSVGKGGANNAGDTLYVQLLLSDALARTGHPPIAVDGMCGPKTIAAIVQFQQVSGLSTDGRVDPNGRTIHALQLKHLQGLGSGSLVHALPSRAGSVRKTLSVSSVQELQNAYLKTLRSALG